MNRSLSLVVLLLGCISWVHAEPGLSDRLIGEAVFATMADGNEHWTRFSTEHFVVLNGFVLAQVCPALAIKVTRRPARFVPAEALKLRIDVLRGKEVLMEVTRPRVIDAGQVASCGMSLDQEGNPRMEGKSVVILHEWRPKDD